MSCRLGVISDTHGRLDPEVLRIFAGVDHIVHAGDVGSEAVLIGLAAIAPVTAVRGNTDHEPWSWQLPDEQVVTPCGLKVLVAHIKDHALRRHNLLLEGIQLFVSGHSHRSHLDDQGDTVFVNPGSAGPSRFGLPRSVALVEVEDGRPRAQIVMLE